MAKFCEKDDNIKFWDTKSQIKSARSFCHTSAATSLIHFVTIMSLATYDKMTEETLFVA